MHMNMRDYPTLQLDTD